jgi:hypothetical protein
VDRSAQTGGFTEELTDFHRITLSHNGLAGSAQMHHHGDDNLSRLLGKRFDRPFVGSILPVIGMNTTEKLVCHNLTSFFLALYEISKITRRATAFASARTKSNLLYITFLSNCPC